MNVDHAHYEGQNNNGLEDEVPRERVQEIQSRCDLLENRTTLTLSLLQLTYPLDNANLRI